MIPVLLLLFIVVPLLELYVILQVGDAIGVLPTIGLLVVDSVLGAMLMRSEGRRAWTRFNLAISEGRVPAREAIDGVLVVFGGALLLTPGFVTDILGAVLLLPFTRPFVRRILVRRFAGRMVASARTVPRRPPTVRVGRRRHRARGRSAATAAVTLPVVDEAPRADVADAVTFSFADVAAGVSGLARAGFTEDGSSGLGVLFSGADPIAARADTATGTDGRAWEAIDAAGVRTTIVEPGSAWTVAFDDGEGHGFALEVTAISPPADLGEGVGGMTGYDHLCRVEGDVRTGSGTVRVSCLGSAGACGARRTGPGWSSRAPSASGSTTTRGSRCTRLAPPVPGARTRRSAARPCSTANTRWPSTTRGCPPSPTSRATSAARAWSSGSTRRTTPAAPRASSSAARRSTSAGCGWTARSCAGAWRASEGAGRYDILRRVG